MTASTSDCQTSVAECDICGILCPFLMFAPFYKPFWHFLIFCLGSFTSHQSDPARRRKNKCEQCKPQRTKQYFEWKAGLLVLFAFASCRRHIDSKPRWVRIQHTLNHFRLMFVWKEKSTPCRDEDANAVTMSRNVQELLLEWDSS